MNSFQFVNFISIQSIPIDNSINGKFKYFKFKTSISVSDSSGDPTVNCLSDRLSVDLKTAKAFGGRVFVKGFSQDSNCNVVGDGATSFDFSINFDNCGLRRSREVGCLPCVWLNSDPIGFQINGVSISATIVVSFHPVIKNNIGFKFEIF